MNRVRRSEKWLSLWLLIAVVGHFAFDHREASAFVLCFGADGHVAVERAGHDPRPKPTRPESGQRRQVFPANADVPCVDIPVAIDDHSSHTPFPEFGKGLSDAGLSALVAFCFILFPLIRTAFAVFRAHSPPRLDSRILLRRSIVLLI